MARNIEFDASDFLKKSTNLVKSVMPNNAKRAVTEVANDLLRLSQFEVPHDKGLLQNSGHTESAQIVGNTAQAKMGYNKVYAARLHENPQFNFQKGRKGKYVEDPLKKNLKTFGRHISQTIKGLL